MKKLFLIIATFTFLFLTSIIKPLKKVNAKDCPPGVKAYIQGQPFPVTLNDDPTRNSLTITVQGLDPNNQYYLGLQRDFLGDWVGPALCADIYQDQDAPGASTFTFTDPKAFTKRGLCNRYIEVFLHNKTTGGRSCYLGGYYLSEEITTVNCQVSIVDDSRIPIYPDKDDSFNIKISGFQNKTSESFRLTCPRTPIDRFLGSPNNDGTFPLQHVSGNQLAPDTYECKILRLGVGPAEKICEFDLLIFEYNDDPYTPPEGWETFEVLKKPEPCGEDRDGDGVGDDIQTALGCFPTEPKAIIVWILKYAIIFGAGSAFLIMLWGAAQIILSAGDPEKLKGGQQILISALGGLLFIIFATFLLRLIGVTILKIPGWGYNVFSTYLTRINKTYS